MKNVQVYLNVFLDSVNCFIAKHYQIMFMSILETWNLDSPK
jgi:histidinol phosphatase-like enzyme